MDTPPFVPGASWAKDIGDLGRRTAVPAVTTPPGTQAKPFVILRDRDGDEQVEWLDEVFEAPHHTAGTFTFDDVASFLAYWKIYANPGVSLMYASLEPAAFVGVINEHAPASPEDASPEGDILIDGADWRDHRCQVVLAHSPEWKAWMARNSKAFENPLDFAQWLEDMLPDIKAPAAGALMEIALSMKVKEATAWKQVGVLASGQIQLGYENIIEGSATTQAGDCKIPDVFLLDIPVFFGLDATRYEVRARLRYRRSGATVRVWYELERPHKVVEAAFKDLYAVVKEACGGVLLGKP